MQQAKFERYVESIYRILWDVRRDKENVLLLLLAGKIESERGMLTNNCERREREREGVGRVRKRRASGCLRGLLGGGRSSWSYSEININPILPK